MVTVAARMRILKNKLRRVRLGEGAAIIEPSSNITRLHLTFTKATQGNGNLAARKFWQLYLPSLKFYNPGLGITVRQLQRDPVSAKLSVYFKNNREMEKTSSSGQETETNAVQDKYAPEPTSSEIVKTINTEHQEPRGIWHELRKLMIARNVRPTEEDRKEIEEANQFNWELGLARKRKAAIDKVKRHQEEMLNRLANDMKR